MRNSGKSEANDQVDMASQSAVGQRLLNTSTKIMREQSNSLKLQRPIDCTTTVLDFLRSAYLQSVNV
jgi:hypothetical protein